jgi:oxygen-independent coproporphyrinogen-3 oxidase
MDSELIKKYNVAAPRYTSYPTVPYWDKTPPSPEEWKLSVKRSFNETNEKDGISIYIHLPFCESLCTYCGCNTRITVNHGVEMPYIQSILKEWSLYRTILGETPRIREIHLGGGTPTFFSAEHLRVLIEGITKGSIICKDAEFGFEAHPGNTNLCHLTTLHDLGFKRLSLGIQDFDEKVQDIINRQQTFEQVKTVVVTARELGYTSINFDLIYGLPLQTKQSIIDTLEQVNQLMPDRIAFYSYAHVPWLKPGQRKFTEADLPVDYEKRQLYELGRDLFKKAGYLDIGMDHFALTTDTLYKAEKNGTLHRNFMGYTHNYTQLMIGLGVSSISDSWYGYVQNIKTVEEYQQAVSKGELPFFKGHLLTAEDLILRRHILNIICKYKTSWEHTDQQCEALHESILRLTELEKDGLIILHHSSLKVTEKGQPFLRNICMAFDARLWRSAPKLQIFSTVA